MTQEIRCPPEAVVLITFPSSGLIHPDEYNTFVERVLELFPGREVLVVPNGIDIKVVVPEESHSPPDEPVAFRDPPMMS